MKFIPTLGGEFSGSLGGLVASRNRGGQYLRRRSMPVNPDSEAQIQARAAVAAASEAWSGLTDQQRADWATYAANVAWVDRLGQEQRLTGPQMFLRSNAIRLQANAVFGSTLPLITDGPTTFLLGPNVPVTEAESEYDPANDILDPPGPTLTTTLTLEDTLPATTQIFLFLGRPRGLTQNFYKGPYRMALEGVGDTTNEVANVVAAGSSYAAKYGVPGAGVRISGYLRLQTQDGRLSGRIGFDVVTTSAS